MIGCLLRSGFLALCLLASLGGESWAQQSSAAADCLASAASGPRAAGPEGALPNPVKVGVFLLPPFAERTKDGYSGMAIDLWQAVAAKLGVTYQYQTFDTVPALLDAVASGKVDVVAGNLAITEPRLLRMDFTQPWLDSGQRIMINRTHHSGLADLYRSLAESGHLQVYMWLAILVVLATIGLTIFDRYFDAEFHPEWHKGFIESFYHVVSVTTSGKTSHKRLFGVYGRIIAAFWMICGVGVVAYITSSITSVMTTSSLSSQITGKASLPGKIVGVLHGTVGADYCFEEALTCVSYSEPNALIGGLRTGAVDAIIGDASVLGYYQHSHPQLPVAVVGSLFRPEKMGFAAPLGSPLIRPMNLAIVADMQNGLIDRLRAKYFGAEP